MIGKINGERFRSPFFVYGWLFTGGLSGRPRRFRGLLLVFASRGEGVAGIGCSSPRICRLAVSGSMPGVGVTPGFSGCIAFAGSGGAMFELPRITFAFTFAVAGIPGVELPLGATGPVVSPGGNAFEFLDSTVWAFALPYAVFVLVSPPPHADVPMAAAAAIINNLFINAFLSYLNIAVPAQRLRPWRSATAFEPARAGI